jgi:hypothetical protein
LRSAHCRLCGDRGLPAGFYGVPEWWLWRWVRRALGQLLARPARSWPLVGKDNFVADQAVAGQVLPPVPGCAGRGPGPGIACPAAARDRRKLGYQVLVQVFLVRGRRSSSLVPPHTPWSCLVSSAKARHCRRTGQRAQIAFAWVTWSREGPDPETGKNSSGSACRHAASSRESRPGMAVSALSGVGEIVISGRRSLGGRAAGPQEPVVEGDRHHPADH